MAFVMIAMSAASARRIVEVLDETTDLPAPKAPVQQVRDCLLYTSLDPHSVEEVEHSGYALVLYTCTYGGKTRVTVFCDRAS